MKLAICIVEPKVNILTPTEWLPVMAQQVEMAGRKSHKSEGRMTDDSAERFIHKVAFHKGHESILEHASITVDMRMSRAASHQLVRHRIGAYTQESQRYCDYSSDKFGQTLEVICPPSILDHISLPSGTLVLAEQGLGEDLDYHVLAPASSIPWPDNEDERPYCRLDLAALGEPFRYWAFTILRAYGKYLWLRDQGVPPEDARFILPNAAKTEIVTTFNVRQWRHFFRMRCDKHAQWEIRGLALNLLQRFRELAPWGFGDPEMEGLLA